VRDFGGVVPQTYPELESLPGVGHKTASVIMSQAFGEPAIAVDTVREGGGWEGEGEGGGEGGNVREKGGREGGSVGV
jgi:hypothetical protein